jgi:hypothetical protein
MNIFEVIGSLFSAKNIALGAEKNHPLYVKLSGKSDEYLNQRLNEIHIKMNSFQALNTRRSKFQFARNVDIWTEEKILKQILTERKEVNSDSFEKAKSSLENLFANKVFIEGDIKDSKTLIFHKVRDIRIDSNSPELQYVDLYLNCKLNDLNSTSIDCASVEISIESVKKNIAERKWFVLPIEEALRLLS